MSPDEVKRLWEEAKRNALRLELCTRHDFVDATPQKTIGKRFRCANCEGEADAVQVMFYRQGLQHAR